jgi:hypothetical protein
MEGFGITGLLLLSLVLATSELRRYSEVQMEPNSLINICFAVSITKQGSNPSCQNHVPGILAVLISYINNEELAYILNFTSFPRYFELQRICY